MAASATESRQRVTVVTPAASGAITLADAKSFLRLTGSAEDTLLTALIGAATGAVEAATGRALVTATLDARFSYVAASLGVSLPHPPAASVVEVKVEDEDGAEQDIIAAEYLAELNGQPAFFRVTESQASVSSTNPVPVRVRYTAGYGGEGAAPETLQQAVRILTAHFYEARGVSPGTAAGNAENLPPAIAMLIDPFVIRQL